MFKFIIRVVFSFTEGRIGDAGDAYVTRQPTLSTLQFAAMDSGRARMDCY